MTNQAYNEIQVLKSCAAGNAAAFEVIVHKYQSLVCAITYSAVGQVEKSEELAQQVFINAWKGLSQLNDLENFKAWLVGITRNVIRTFYRTQKRDIVNNAASLDAVGDTPDTSSLPDQVVISKEQEAIVYQSLERIPEIYREPMVLFYRQQQSTREVAEALDLTEETVRTRLMRGRKMLKDQVAAMVESTLSHTGPGKTFTTMVVASIAGLALTSTTASAAIAATGTTTGTATASATATSSGLTALTTGITAKILTAVAVVAIAVGGVITYNHLSQSDSESTHSDEIAVVSVEQEPIPTPYDVQPALSEAQTVIVDSIETPIIKKATPPSNEDLTNTTKMDDDNGFQMAVKVLEKETGKPIPNVEIRTYDGKKNPSSKTGTNGICEIKAGQNGATSINLFAANDGYVSQSFTCGEGRMIDYFPEEVVFKLEKGTVVGGIVQDPNGTPLEAATVSLDSHSGINEDNPGIDVRFREKTDKQGRWHCTIAPKDLEGCTVGASHPEYDTSDGGDITQGEMTNQLRMEIHVLKMKKLPHFSIAGFVKDEAGNPVKGAKVQRGDWFMSNDRQHRTHTDENGYFEFRDLLIRGTDFTYDEIEGKGRVPVQYPADYLTVTADGFAPQLMQVFFRENDMLVESIMTAGNPIYGRVVDYEGNPVVEATVRADDWKSRYPDEIRPIDWNTKTDTEGRFVWQNAPTEEVELIVSKDGYLTLTGTKVVPSDIEYEFVLNPQVRVIGKVIDAVTKDPITEFTFRRHEGGYTRSPKLINDSEGKFETSFADQGETFTISFESQGYKPIRSREISLIEQNVELTVEMQPDTGIDGVVIDADGKPLKDVLLIVPNGVFDFNDDIAYRMTRLRYHTNTKTDAEGKFHFDPIAADKYSILAIEEQGYLYVHSTDFPKNGMFVLQPYGRIEGTYYKGRNPVANETIRIDYPYYHFYDMKNLAVQYGTQTNEDGEFIFDKLIHGTARIYSVDPYKHVEVKAGQTHELHIGGTGLTVQGHILNPDGRPLNEDFGQCSLGCRRIYDTLPVPEEEWPLPDGADAMSYTGLMEWFTEFGSSDEGQKWLKAIEQKYGDLTESHGFGVDPNGRFEAPNITPGTYLFTATVKPWQNPDQFPRRADYNAIIAQASAVFIVPEFDTVEDMDIPVDLGTVQCRPAPLSAGQKAPDFDIPKLKSAGRIRLSDYRGKTVLLNFTNPAQEDTEPDNAVMLEQVCERAKGKTEIINVAMEMIPWDYMRQKMIPECDLPGLYGVATTHNTKIDADYKTRHTVPLPYSVLIDSTGTILWIGEPNEELLKELENH